MAAQLVPLNSSLVLASRSPRRVLLLRTLELEYAFAVQPANGEERITGLRDIAVTHPPAEKGQRVGHSEVCCGA